jgi:hypothetical protein
MALPPVVRHRRDPGHVLPPPVTAAAVDRLLTGLGSMLAGALIGSVCAVYGTRHITARSIGRLEASGRTDEALAYRAVLHARGSRRARPAQEAA